MATATVPAGSTCEQTADPAPGLGDEGHAPSPWDHWGDDLHLERVSILGSLDAGRYIAGNAMLADLRLRGIEGDGPKTRALLDFQDDQLGELAYPAGDLADVALKIAWAVRLSGSASGIPVDEQRTRLLGSALADVILLRQGELVRRQRSARKAEAGRRRAETRRAARGAAEAPAEVQAEAPAGEDGR